MTILKEPLVEQINHLIDIREELIENLIESTKEHIWYYEKAIDNIEKRLLDLGHSLKGLRKRNKWVER